MSDQQQTAFEGWAIVDLFGHRRFAGFLKTEYFGPACMFRCDVPALEERTRITKRAGSVDGKWAPAGTTVKEGATPGYSKFFGVSAIYELTPCTQEACLAAVEEIQPRPLMLVALPTENLLPPPVEANDEEVCSTCGRSEPCNCDTLDEEAF